MLTGTLQQLNAAFKLAGWSQADRLGLASSWRMIQAFVFNSPYPTAPFSTLLYRLGILQPGAPPEPLFDALRERLKELGYAEGYNIAYEYRWAEGKVHRLPELRQLQLLRKKPPKRSL